MRGVLHVYAWAGTVWKAGGEEATGGENSPDLE